MAMNFSPVETKKANEYVFEQIENLILSGKLKPGDKLPSERELMEIYKRSHPTIREALRMLESSNYIRVIPGGGAEVCYSSTENIQESIIELLQFRKVPVEDIYHFCQLSEPEFIKQAVQHFTWEDLVSLEQLCEEMRDNMDNVLAYTTKLFAFHIELMKATHNPLLYVFWNSMGVFWTQEKLNHYQDSIHIQDIGQLQELNIDLLKAFKGKDAERASELVHGCWQNWQLIVSKGEA